KHLMRRAKPIKRNTNCFLEFIEQNPGHMSKGKHVYVGSVSDAVEVGLRSRTTASTTDVRLRYLKAHLTRTIHVNDWIACFGHQSYFEIIIVGDSSSAYQKVERLPA